MKVILFGVLFLLLVVVGPMQAQQSGDDTIIASLTRQLFNVLNQNETLRQQVTALNKELQTVKQKCGDRCEEAKDAK